MQHIGEHGIVRSRDIEAIGFPRQYLVRLHRQGKRSRPARGIYTLPDADVTEYHSYAESPSESRRPPSASFRRLSFTRSRRKVLLRFGSLSPRGQERLLSLRLHSRSFACQGHHSRRESTNIRWRALQSGSIQPRRPSRLFQISEQNRRRRRNRSPKGLSSSETSQHRRNLPATPKSAGSVMSFVAIWRRCDWALTMPTSR
jgi:hypothetical protein